MKRVLKEGRKAPAFSLPSSEGGTIRLRDLRGQAVVLYFYPRDIDARGVVRKG